MTYAIASHVDYPAPRERLLASLASAGVDLSAVKVYVSGAAGEGDLMGARWVGVEHNSFEYTPLIHVVESGVPEDVFLLHDTCEVFGAFATQSTEAPADGVFRSVDVAGWTNMGYFTAGYLASAWRFILSMRGCSKDRAQLAERLFTRLGPWDSYSDRPYRVVGESDVYGGGVPRQHLVFDGLDMIKFMANHGRSAQRFNRP